MKYLTTLLLFLFSYFSLSSQVLTIQQGGATGTSGTGWSISGSNPTTLTITANATIAPSVLSNYLTGGAELEIWTGSVVFSSDFSFSNATLTLRLSNNSVSGVGNLGLGAGAVFAVTNGSTISNNIEFTGNGKIQFAPLDFEYLVVGGGGGGGGGYDTGGGGGGGGGMVLSGNSSVNVGTSLPIVVGSGGAASWYDYINGPKETNGGSGSSSFLGTLEAFGGGFGYRSRSGGSGVGGSGQVSTTNPPNGGIGGGNGLSASRGSGGGGGGAGSAGANGVSNVGGSGGQGIASTITGTTTVYGAGGNGARGNAATSGVNGTNNLGQGGSAGGFGSNGARAGGAGGSGIVVIRYRGPQVSISGTVSTISVSGINYTVHKFLSGTSNFDISDGVMYLTGTITGIGSGNWNALGGTIVVSGSYGLLGSTIIEAGTLSIIKDQPTFGNPNFSGPGSLVIEPNSTSFSSPLSTLNWTFNNNLTGLRIGKLGNNSDVSLESGVSLNGDLVVHGGAVVVASSQVTSGNQEFNANQLFIEENIKSTGSGSIILNSPNTRVSPGKSIWSAADLTNNGELLLEGENAPDGNYSQLKFNGNYVVGTGSKVIQQQYLESGYHLMGSPFSAVTGEFFGSANTAVGGVGETGHSVGNSNLWSWNGSDWVVVLNNSTSLTEGQGYSGIVSNLGFRKQEGLHSFEGVTPNKQVSFALNYAETNQSISIYNEGSVGRWGWNLVANPFTCVLDYSSVTKPANSSMNGAIYRWKGSLNNGQGGYEEHSPSGPPEDLYIAPLQSFWVQTKNNLPTGATLTMSMAAHGDVTKSPVFRKTVDFDADRYGIVVESNDQEGLNDACYVAFAEEVDDGFDSDWDAFKLYDGPGSIAIYSWIDKKTALANNAVTYPESQGRPKVLDVVFDPTSNSGAFNLRLDRTFATGNLKAYIEDPLSGMFQELTEDPYTFHAQSELKNYFRIHFRNEKTQSLISNSTDMLSVWFGNNELKFWSEVESKGDWVLVGLDGREVAFGKVILENQSVSGVSLPLRVNSGVYFVRIRLENGAVHFKRISITQ